MNSKLKERQNFTLVELLVVITIISVLAGILLPALEQAITATRSITCSNNMKQVALSMTLYANDYEGFFAPEGQNIDGPHLYIFESTEWNGGNYLSNPNKGKGFGNYYPELLNCPEDDVMENNYLRRTFMFNRALEEWPIGKTSSLNINQIGNPSQFIMLTESSSGSRYSLDWIYGRFERLRKVEHGGYLQTKHGVDDSATFAFADTHVIIADPYSEGISPIDISYGDWNTWNNGEYNKYWEP